jgi:anti-sigma regulatory factor (Ser/Thr protein kinase)
MEASSSGARHGVSPMELEKRFPREFTALESILDFVLEFYARSGIAAPDPSQVQLMIEEIFTNMIKYNDGHQNISIRLRRMGDHLEICLTDFDVEPFDYASAPEVDMEQLLERKQSGGLGLHLVKKMADRMTYEYVDRNSKLTILKRLGG